MRPLQSLCQEKIILEGRCTFMLWPGYDAYHFSHNLLARTRRRLSTAQKADGRSTALYHNFPVPLSILKKGLSDTKITCEQAFKIVSARLKQLRFQNVWLDHSSNSSLTQSQWVSVKMGQGQPMMFHFSPLNKLSKNGSILELLAKFALR